MHNDDAARHPALTSRRATLAIMRGEERRNERPIVRKIAIDFAGAAFLLAASHGAWAEDGATRAASSSDKSAYDLFDPTPADRLRGMDTDRPNKTNTPHTIDAGHIQVETGIFDYAHNRDRSQGADATTDMLALGRFNIRLGVLDNVEVNVAFDSDDLLWSKDHLAQQSTRQQGFGDIVAGGKVNLWGGEGSDAVWSTALALQPQFKIPTAQGDLGNGHPEFFFGAPFLANLPADFHLGLQTTVSWERNLANTGDVTGWQNSASLDRVLFDTVDVYVEYWSHVSSERHIAAQQTFDVGFIYAVSDNLTVDAGANIGLNKASNTLELLSGFSLRF